MRRLQTVLVAALGVVLLSGCGADKIKQLTAEVETVKAQLAQAEKARADAEAAKARLEAELAATAAERQQIAAIRKGYEEAREKFTAQLKGLAPMVGEMPSPLPPFEGLADSSWVGRLAPGGAKLVPDAKQLEGMLKGLLGEPSAKPAP